MLVKEKIRTESLLRSLGYEFFASGIGDGTEKAYLVTRRLTLVHNSKLHALIVQIFSKRYRITVDGALFNFCLCLLTRDIGMRCSGERRTVNLEFKCIR